MNKISQLDALELKYGIAFNHEPLNWKSNINEVVVLNSCHSAMGCLIEDEDEEPL